MSAIPKVETSTVDGEIVCSIEETNRLRASLGLKPLEVDGPAVVTEESPIGEDVSYDSRPEVLVGPEVERKRLAEEAEEKHRQLELKKENDLVLKGPTVGDVALRTGEADTTSWAAMMLKKKRAMEENDFSSDEEDGEINDAAEEHAKEITGMNIAHSLDKLDSGTTILTFKDENVLGKDGELNLGESPELENIELKEDDKRNETAYLKKKAGLASYSSSYSDESDDDDMVSSGQGKLLKQYNQRRKRGAMSKISADGGVMSIRDEERRQKRMAKDDLMQKRGFVRVNLEEGESNLDKKVENKTKTKDGEFRKKKKRKQRKKTIRSTSSLLEPEDDSDDDSALRSRSSVQQQRQKDSENKGPSRRGQAYRQALSKEADKWSKTKAVHGEIPVNEPIAEKENNKNNKRIESDEGDMDVDVAEPEEVTVEAKGVVLKRLVEIEDDEDEIDLSALRASRKRKFTGGDNVAVKKEKIDDDEEDEYTRIEKASKAKVLKRGGVTFSATSEFATRMKAQQADEQRKERRKEREQQKKEHAEAKKRKRAERLKNKNKKEETKKEIVKTEEPMDFEISKDINEDEDSAWRTLKVGDDEDNNTTIPANVPIPRKVEDDQSDFVPVENAPDVDDFVAQNSLSGMAAALNMFRDRGELKAKRYYFGGANDTVPEENNVATARSIGVKPRNKKNLKKDDFAHITLEKRDEFGNLLTTKQAYREQSYAFHGIKPGKKKQEKNFRKMRLAKERMKMQGGRDALSKMIS